MRDRAVVLVLGGLAHVQRRVLQERGGHELGVALGHPPGDDAAQRVADEHRRAAHRLAQDADDVLAVVVDVVGPRGVLGAAVAAQVDRARSAGPSVISRGSHA